MKAAVIFPHQLFKWNPCLTADVEKVFLIEEPLLFTQYKFHKQKLVLHRASMKFYESYLKERKFEIAYIESGKLENTSSIARILERESITEASYCDVTDDWLEKRFRTACTKKGIKLTKHDTPYFLNSATDIARSFPVRKHYSFTDFYRKERIRLGIFMEDEKPVGGKWTFDTENRKKLPKKIFIPEITRPDKNPFVAKAIEYVDKNFATNYGDSNGFAYPVSFEEADLWLDQFLNERLHDFGEFEDAISSKEATIFHSLLTPMLNIGLLTPRQVIDKTLSYAEENNVPLNSLEGFIRQVIGWREFMRGTYEVIGRKQRTTNFWGHHRKLPHSFWTAQIGIAPLDIVLKRVLDTGYCHHIERLMILGNFMLLIEADPHDAYLWFMEMFIDSYDWVMVGNVYGMSQYADGGLMTTKPYISGSNYIKKMSDFEPGEWCNIWDGLYWRFILKHRDFFAKNPRLSVMSLALNKMAPEKLEKHLTISENYLNSIL